MRLSPDILLRAENYLNPVKEREINLRGFKFSLIENISVLQDQFDVIDLSDNEIRKLENFPKMQRLSTILLNNNYVSRISSQGEFLVNLQTLVLTNNRISNFSEIDNIASFTKLTLLSLIDNPVTKKESYRLYTIFKIPSLKSLDFRKVRKEERTQATALFTSTTGQALLTTISQEQSQTQAAIASRKGITATLTDAQKSQIRDAIAAASTPEEMDRIEKQLRAGTFKFLETDITTSTISSIALGVNTVPNTGIEMTVEDSSTTSVASTSDDNETLTTTKKTTITIENNVEQANRMEVEP